LCAELAEPGFGALTAGNFIGEIAVRKREPATPAYETRSRFSASSTSMVWEIAQPAWLVAGGERHGGLLERCREVIEQLACGSSGERYRVGRKQTGDDQGPPHRRRARRRGDPVRDMSGGGGTAAIRIAEMPACVTSTGRPPRRRPADLASAVTAKMDVARGPITCTSRSAIDRDTHGHADDDLHGPSRAPPARRADG
jgi:hypothetical protein